MNIKPYFINELEQFLVKQIPLFPTPVLVISSQTLILLRWHTYVQFDQNSSIDVDIIELIQYWDRQAERKGIYVYSPYLLSWYIKT